MRNWSISKKFNMACLGIALSCAAIAYAVEFFKK